MVDTITREKKTLREKLLEMIPLEPLVIRRAYYTPTFVRRVVKELNLSGYSYEATEKDMVDGIKVERIK